MATTIKKIDHQINLEFLLMFCVVCDEAWCSAMHCVCVLCITNYYHWNENVINCLLYDLTTGPHFIRFVACFFWLNHKRHYCGKLGVAQFIRLLDKWWIAIAIHVYACIPPNTWGAASLDQNIQLIQQPRYGFVVEKTSLYQVVATCIHCHYLLPKHMIESEKQAEPRSVTLGITALGWFLGHNTRIAQAKYLTIFNIPVNLPVICIVYIFVG